MTHVILVSRAPGCKGVCSRMNIIVRTWKVGRCRYSGGVKYCTRCELFMKCDKIHCPCCGCSFRSNIHRRGKYRQARKRTRPQEVRNKIRFGHLGLKLSEETKQKISAALKGRIFLDAHRLKIAQALKGKQIRKGTKTSEQARKNLSLARVGKHHSEETRHKMRLAHIRRCTMYNDIAAETS